jgi:voltage-gated potassium channel Kch
MGPVWRRVALFNAALLELLIDHLIDAGADLVDALGPLSGLLLLTLMSSSVSSRIVAGTKLGGNERGGNSLNVFTNAPTSSIAP